MNLEKLFKMQKELDKRILERFPKLRNENLLDKKILALQVELGELAQNWRGFKFWSEDQKPRTREYLTNYTEQDSVLGPGAVWKNPLLEEYVDCLHFILGIGLEIETEQDILPEPIKYDNTVTQFNELFGQISYFASVLNRDNGWEYERVWSLFFGLGSMLGFTEDEIEQAYFAKNKVNHQRQEDGY